MLGVPQIKLEAGSSRKEAHLPNNSPRKVVGMLQKNLAQWKYRQVWIQPSQPIGSKMKGVASSTPWILKQKENISSRRVQKQRGTHSGSSSKEEEKEESQTLQRKLQRLIQGSDTVTALQRDQS